MTDLITRLRALADCYHRQKTSHLVYKEVESLAREAAAEMERLETLRHRPTDFEVLLHQERDAALARIQALEHQVQDVTEGAQLLAKERDEALAKLADAEKRCDLWVERAHTADAKLAEAEDEVASYRLLNAGKEGMRSIQRMYLEARAEAAALREAAQVVSRFHWGDGSVTRDDVMVALGSFSQPGPGAAYQERVRLLAAVAEAADNVAHRCYSQNNCGICPSCRLSMAPVALRDHDGEETK